MKVRRILVICLSAFLVYASGCGMSGGEGASSAITSSRSSFSSAGVSGAAVPASSSVTPTSNSEQSFSNRGVSSKYNARENASSKFNGVVLFSETPGVHGVFWLGMTESEAFSSMKANNIFPDQPKEADLDEFGAIIETEPGDHSFGIFYTIYTTGFSTLEFNKEKKLIYFATNYPPQDWQKEAQKISSTYVTEKGVKLHDSFDVVEKLYGKPTAIINISPLIYTYKLCNDLYVAFRGIKQNGANEIDLFEYSTSDKFDLL